MKKKILLLSRPVVNAGDFLFAEKSYEALRIINTENEIVRGHISENYDSDFLNSFHTIVAAGGPIYDNRFLNEEAFPALKQLDKISSEFFILAGGWYGRTDELDLMTKFRFNEATLNCMKKAIKNGRGAFSCRGDISAFVLKQNGFCNNYMVGCSAWYDYEFLNNLKPRYDGNVDRIIISDQGITKDSSAWDWKFKSLENTIKVIKKVFPKSEILFSFNGGIDTRYSGVYNRKVVGLLESYGINYKDISGSVEGFKLYDKIDLHVGFRMHSHIYCMSRRIPSILISEDARGAECNISMGLPDIKDYCIKNGDLKNNGYIEEQIEYYLGELLKSDFAYLSSAYMKMREVYEYSFAPFIRRICE